MQVPGNSWRPVSPQAAFLSRVFGAPR